jgi:hypothetical protein
MRSSNLKRYGYAWVTLGFFVVSLTGHWLFGWFAYVSEQQAHQQPLSVAEYAVQMTRDTLENWQSEFLQLLWQVGGLALLLHVGSPQSKEGDDRMEAKIDALLLAVDPAKGERGGLGDCACSALAGSPPQSPTRGMSSPPAPDPCAASPSPMPSRPHSSTVSASSCQSACASPNTGCRHSLPCLSPTTRPLRKLGSPGGT